MTVALTVSFIDKFLTFIHSMNEFSLRAHFIAVRNQNQFRISFDGTVGCKIGNDFELLVTRVMLRTEFVLSQHHTSDCA